MRYKVKYITGRNDSGVYLDKEDLNLLLFLYEQKVLTQPQLYEVYKLFLNKDYTYRSFCNKMNKFEKQGLIIRKAFDLIKRNKIFVYFVYVSETTLNILYHAGYITQKLSFNSSMKYYEHNLGIRQASIEIHRIFANEIGFSRAINRQNERYFYLYRNIIKKEKENKYKPLFYYQNKYLGKNSSQTQIRHAVKKYINNKEEMLPTSFSHINHYYDYLNIDSDKRVKELFPDWIYLFQDTTFDIELDTGTEHYFTIAKKIKNYIELANLDSEHRHKVLIIYLDKSIVTGNDFSIQKNRYKKMKETLMLDKIEKRSSDNSTDILDLNIRENRNIDVYIFPLTRLNVIFSRLMLNNYKTYRELKYEFYKKVKKKYKINVSKKMKYFQIVSRSGPFNLLPVYLKEGDIRSMDSFSRLGVNVARSKYKQPTVIVGIYDTKDEMTNDIVTEQVQKYHHNLIFYCLDTEKFYDVKNQKEVYFD